MAIDAVKEVVGRVAADENFRRDFFDPKCITQVLAPYGKRLTPEELECLKELTPEKVGEYVKNVRYSSQDIRI